MNARRNKRIKKTIAFYERSFGFFAPYNILLDGTFCRAALEAKVNIAEQLPKYFKARVNIVTTQCVIMEVEKLTKIIKDLYGAYLIVKQFPVHKCGHKLNPQPASICMKSLLQKNNPHRYIVATMDLSMRDYIHTSVIGVPILFLHAQAPVIEKPNDITKEAVASADSASISHEFKTLNEIKRNVLDEKEITIRKRKKLKHPNPLSRLKSTKIKMVPQTKTNSKTTRRKKNKLKEDIYESIKKVFQDSSHSAC